MEKILNKKDLAILQEFDKDVRASYAQIGRKTRLSKEVVQYRIKKLEQKGIITGYWAIPHIGTINSVYKLLIKNKSLGIKKKQEFINYALSQKAVSWFATTEGNWDFVISSYVKEDRLFSQFVINLMEKFGKYLKEKQIVKATSMISMNEKYLYDDGKLLKTDEDSFLKTIAEPDEKDSEIIGLLSGNARMSFREIGKNVKLTPEAVSIRFRKIIKTKLIKGMSPRINHEKLGLEYYHVFISVSDYEKKDSICNYYIQHPACVFIMKHIGFYDIHLEIVVKSGEINALLDELSERFGDYISAYEPLRVSKEHIMVVQR